MTVMQYPKAEQYRAQIEAAARAHGVPGALLGALCAQESEFNPRAFRSEPQIGDASRGLLQLLFKTARLFQPSLTPEQLFTPAVNLDIGARFMADLLRAAARGGYGIDAAISSYNAGGSGVRPGDGKRPGVNKTTPAEAMRHPFGNQRTYVDPVLAKMRAFQAAGYSTAAPAYTNAGGRVPAGLTVALALIASGAVLALRRFA